MKIKELFEKVYKSVNNEGGVDIEEFRQLLGVDSYIGWSEEFDNRVKSYFILNWMCTDTVVGAKVYFFDDKPLCLGIQTARKSDEQYEFVSQEIADELKSFILSLAEEDERKISLLSMEDEFGSEYDIYFAGQLMGNHTKGCVNGRCVEVKESVADRNNYICNQTVVVFLDTGEEAVVETESIKFPLNVVEIA